jgi:dolichol-phosphate mannosyltransferase
MDQLLDKNWEIPTFQTTEFKPRENRYCVCIPIINEGDKFKKQLTKMSHLSKVIDIIICDGGSTDGSTNEDFLKECNTKALLVKTGKGKLSAQLRMGYAYALTQGYEGIITIDGNGKDDIATIPDFIKSLDEGFDFVQGSRFIPGGKAINTPLSRLLAIKLIHAPFSSFLSGFHYADTTNGYRAYSSKFLCDEQVSPFRDIFETYELIAYLSVRAPQLHFKVKEIPVTREYPKNVKTPTKISPIKGNLKLIEILIGLLFGRYNPLVTKNKNHTH